jgi:hypothetical protein
VPIPAMVIDPLGPPALPDTGLIEAATGPLPLPVHAKTSGAQYLADSCGEARLYPAPCQTPPYPAMVLDSGDGLVSAFVFNVYASQVCGTAGQSAAEAERRVRARLRVGEARAVERAFWGAVAGTEGFDSVLEQLGAGITDLGTAASEKEAVSLLEQQMAGVYGGEILLHARPRMAAYLGNDQLVSGRPPRTTLGSRVVFGYGYAGTGPANEAPDATTEWMVATGRVILWRDGDVFVSPPDQLIDKATNQRGLFAVRTYAIAVECGGATVQVTRG